jgi:hypothetical protein
VRLKAVKIGDSSPEMTKGSRADKYWKSHEMTEYYKKVRPKLDLPEKFKTNDLGVIVKTFNIKGVGFGNWLTINDRTNYTDSLVLALYDLNKLLRFKYNVGFGHLGITFGARGGSSALAHFEPGNDIINITRYHDGEASKEARFFATGGLGSLAHEYGHFLDYFAGSKIATHSQIYSLTNGRSVNKNRTDTGNKIRNIVDDILELIMFKKPGGELSNYYKRLEAATKGEYWFRRNEIFARAFEVYCSNKFSELGIRNNLLVSKKYSSSYYLKDSEMKPIIPKFDSLITEIRNNI